MYDESLLVAIAIDMMSHDQAKVTMADLTPMFAAAIPPNPGLNPDKSVASDA